MGGTLLTEFDVDAQYVISGSLTSANFANSMSINAGSVSWYYDGTPGDTVSFQSDYGPGYGGSSAFVYGDDNDLLSSNPGGSAVAVPTLAVTPTPVPEASTVMAGAMMLLPLGMGMVRFFRKRQAA